jgi:uncharacterized membrane protein HdeD (DUF308 family)
MFFQTPLSGVHAIGVLMGVKLVFVGVAALVLGSSLHGVMKSTSA